MGNDSLLAFGSAIGQGKLAQVTRTRVKLTETGGHGVQRGQQRAGHNVGGAAGPRKWHHRMGERLRFDGRDEHVFGPGRLQRGLLEPFDVHVERFLLERHRERLRRDALEPAEQRQVGVGEAWNNSINFA